MYWALCLSSLDSIVLWESHVTPTASHYHEDKHKAPTLPLIHPLSLQDGGASLPYSIGNVHHDSS